MGYPIVSSSYGVIVTVIYSRSKKMFKTGQNMYSNECILYIL